MAAAMMPINDDIGIRIRHVSVDDTVIDISD